MSIDYLLSAQLCGLDTEWRFSPYSALRGILPGHFHFGLGFSNVANNDIRHDDASSMLRRLMPPGFDLERAKKLQPPATYIDITLISKTTHHASLVAHRHANYPLADGAL